VEGGGGKGEEGGGGHCFVLFGVWCLVLGFFLERGGIQLCIQNMSDYRAENTTIHARTILQ